MENQPVPEAPTPPRSTNLFSLLIAVLIVAAIVFLKLKCPGPFQSVNVQTDSTQPVSVSPDRVTYTPKISKENPHPKPLSVWKPIESVPVIKNGETVIPFGGFCLIPKLGACYVLGNGLQGYGSIRFIYLAVHDTIHLEKSGWDLGMEFGGNIHNAFLGVDVRDPIFNLLTTSVGAALPWGDPFKTSVYLGESASLSL